MLTTLGWIGSWALAICGAPEAWKAFKNKDSSLGWPFLCLWYMGEIFVLLPVMFELKTPYLMLNYGLNVFFISVIIGYKIKAKLRS